MSVVKSSTLPTFLFLVGGGLEFEGVSLSGVIWPTSLCKKKSGEASPPTPLKVIFGRKTSPPSESFVCGVDRH